MGLADKKVGAYPEDTPLQQKNRDSDVISNPDVNFHNENPHVEPEEERVELKRQVGIVGCISLIVGVMIGSGIFASPRSVFLQANSVGMALVVWSGCGVIAMSGALCYAELGTAIQESGGERSYLAYIFGGWAGFLYSWTAILVMKPSVLAAVTIACAEYILEPFFPGCSQDPSMTHVKKMLAGAGIGIIALVNCASVKLATRVQVIFTAAKLFAIALLIITGIVRLAQGFDENFSNAFEGTSTSVSNIGYAFYGGLWAYDGWNNLNYVTEELKNPLRDLPLAIMIGIPLVTGCYVLVNVAYLTVLTKVEIATSGAVAVTLADRLYGVMAWVIPILVACSTFGAANGSAFTGSRLVYVSAREGHMPKILSMIHTKRHTPLPALLFTCTISWIMLIPDSSNFETLINYFSFAAWTFYGATVSALLYLRYREPHLERPYKVFTGIPVLVLLVSIYLVVAPFYDSPLQSFFCLLFILMGVPVYYCLVHRNLLPGCVQHCLDVVTYQLQLVGDLAPPAETSTEVEEVEME